MSTTACLSGPARTRAHAQLALLEAGYPPVDERHPQAHARMDWPAKLPPTRSGKEPKQPHEFLTVITDDVNEVVALVAAHRWVLRVHYPTPDPPEPDPIAATFADLRREIAELKAKVG